MTRLTRVLRLLSNFLITFGVVTLFFLAVTSDEQILYYTETYSAVEARVLMAFMAAFIGIGAGLLLRLDRLVPDTEDAY